jgi:hypothetical protein
MVDIGSVDVIELAGPIENPFGPKVLPMSSE